MPRFVSKHRSYSHGVRDEFSEHYAHGKSKVIERRLEAQFQPRGIRDYEVEEGLRKLTFQGLPIDRDTQVEVSGRSQLSIFDSNEAQAEFRWSDEEHDLVVQALRTSPMYGLEFIEVEEPKKPEPWPGYDKLNDVVRIVEAVKATGIDPRVVIEYELQNKDRAPVVNELELLLEDEPPASTEGSMAEEELDEDEVPDDLTVEA